MDRRTRRWPFAGPPLVLPGMFVRTTMGKVKYLDGVLRLRGRHSGSRSGHALLPVPLCLVVVILVADVLTNQGSQLGPLLIVAPALTSSFAGPRLTGAMGVLAVAGQLLVPVLKGGVLTPGYEIQAAGIAVVSLVLVALSARSDVRERQLERTQNVATEAQAVLMRPLPRRCGSLHIATDYIAAELHAQIGGDLYAAVHTGGATRLVIGDVRGKGLPAIKDSSLLLGAFHSSAYRALSLPRMAVHLGSALTWHWERAADEDPLDAGESFVTALLLDFPDETETVEMITCGHPPPVLLHEDRVATLETGSPGLPLGLVAATEDEYAVDTFAFRTGDILLLYTDGVTETPGPGGAFYPLTERITDCHRPGGPEELVQCIHEDLLRYAQGRLTDDAALVAIQRIR
ncbi:PP2C family protein-serine/threonine phosphatase [Streptomyces mexicanus]|uniref:PP2C family protein-serine/threonine phosphatase n=2 Tax=Streptomyces mexicanus TaxID=178566 RepID=UPI0036A6A00B